MKLLMQAIHGSFCILWKLTGEGKQVSMVLTPPWKGATMHFQKMPSGCSLHQTTMRIHIVAVSMKDWAMPPVSLLFFVQHGMESRLFIAARNYPTPTACSFLKKTRYHGQEILGCTVSIKHY